MTNTIEIAHKVNNLIGTCNRRYVRALRSYSRRNPSRSWHVARQLFAKVDYYSKEQDRRLAKLLALLK